MSSGGEACATQIRFQWEQKPPVAERVALFKRLCDPATAIAVAEDAIRRAGRAPAADDEEARQHAARKINLSAAERLTDGLIECRLETTMLLAFFYAWAGLVIAFSGFAGGALGILLTLPFSAVPVWLAHRRAKRSQGVLAAYVRAFLTALGHADERLFHLTKSMSVGVNPAARRLVLGDGSAVKAYDFSDIRDWETREERAASVAAVSGSLVGVLSAGGANIGAHNVAASRSGLFIRVRDLDRPEWLITMDQPTRAKWFEIMTQSIEEAAD